MSGQVDIHGATHRGRVRERNEDQFLIADLDKSLHVRLTTLPIEDDTRVYASQSGLLMLVADGMGGASSGEVASKLATETATRYMLGMLPWFYGLQAGHEDDLLEHLTSTLKKCQTVVAAEAVSRDDEKPMGTTMTLAYVLGQKMFLVHVGDSRCYLQRGSQITQLTTDHTIAQQLLAEGAIDEAQIEQSPLKHVLWNAIGGGEEGVEPEVSRVLLEPDDTIVLCTDGLTGHVDDDALQAAIVQDASAQSTCEYLINSANEAGGSDNITVIVARFRSF